MELTSLENILKERIESFNQKGGVKTFDELGKDYTKKWHEGVKHFMIIINKERVREKLLPLPFIAVRQKLLALKEIDDLRWFYYHCKKYAGTKDKIGRKNTFSKCFFGALK